MTLLANLDLTLTSGGNIDSTYVDPLVVDRLVFTLPLLVGGISFSAVIEANVSAILTFKGSGSMTMTAGKQPTLTPSSDQHAQSSQ